MASLLKRFLVGEPLASADEHHTRLPKLVALPVFASDAISSTSYASEEIMHVLVPAAGLEQSLAKLVPIAIVVMILLFLVITSYRQTIHAYPNGGGSYVVSRENLGTTPSLVAGASLMVDYILTVAVSISAGVAAILSAVDNETLRDLRVELCVGLVLLMMVANLRGLKESGKLFAPPTYLYIGMLALMLGIGLYRSFFGDLDALAPNEEALHELGAGTGGGLTLFILLRAFSSGAIALSGTEAISDGVPAFKQPSSDNAAKTLTIMGFILGTFFFGISVLAHRLRPTPSEHETLLSIMGGAVLGDGSLLYLVLQVSTFAILILAANTAFADFPRLSSFIAKDGFLPRQLAKRGDRLVFSNGVVLLSLAACVLLIAFGGQTTLLIHLYAVGVFTGFTLSQAGMVKYHLRERKPGWQRSLVINGVGSFATGVVLIVVIVSKFTVGAWIPTALIPMIVILFKGIRRHYDRVESALQVPEGYRPRRHTHTVVVLVGTVHRATLAAVAYAKSLAPDRLVALTVASEAEEAERVQAQWEQFHIDVPLRVLSSPYRELSRPVIAELDDLDAQYDNDIITVILPEFVLTKWWEQLLHNQSALLLKGRLLFRRNTVVVSVPYHIDGASVDVPGMMESPNRG